LITLHLVLASSLLSLRFDSARAQNSDDTGCAATVYDSPRPASAIADTITACSRIIEGASSTKEARGQAYFVRGLNHFLDAMNLVTAAKKPPSQAGTEVQARVDAALADLAWSIKTAPQHSAQVLSLRATIHRVFNRSDEALADTAKAIAADPKDAVPHVVQAGIFERQDRFSEARTELDTALSLDPGNAIARLARARLWTRYGDIDRVFADYDSAVNLGGPTVAEALSGRARLALRLGNPGQACADWTRAAEMSPLPLAQAQFHTRAGNVARDSLKDHNLAIAAYGRAIAAQPSSAEPYIQRAIAHERAGHPDEAATDYRKALDRARTSPDQALSAPYIRLRLDLLRGGASRRSDSSPLSGDVHRLSGERPRDGSRRVALVIGNATYRHVAPLDNTDRDAQSVAAALAGAGFAEVTIAINLDQRRFHAVLADFTASAAAADWAMIYFSGHGIEVDGRNYLIPIDARLQTLATQIAGATPPSAGAIALDEVLAASAPARKLRLVVLDACRDNPFVQEAHRVAARNTASPDASSTPATGSGEKAIGGGFTATTLRQPDTLVLYATQPGQVALDGDELNSPFTRAFLRNNAVPGQDLATFLSRLHDDVAKATERRQLPAVIGQLRQGERFYFYPPL